MSESLRLTVKYEAGDDGFVIATIPDIPGAYSQGRTREEAKANVVDALRELLAARAQAAGDAGRDSLDLTISG